MAIHLAKLFHRHVQNVADMPSAMHVLHFGEHDGDLAVAKNFYTYLVFFV